MVINVNCFTGVAPFSADAVNISPGLRRLSSAVMVDFECKDNVFPFVAWEHLSLNHHFAHLCVGAIADRDIVDAGSHTGHIYLIGVQAIDMRESLLMHYIT